LFFESIKKAEAIIDDNMLMVVMMNAFAIQVGYICKYSETDCSKLF